MPALDPMRCKATSKQHGGQCKRKPIPGGTVCHWHGGAAPQVKFKALERFQAFQPEAFRRLCELALQKDYPSTAMSAVKDVFDRTMGKPAETVSMEVSGSLDIVGILRQRAERRKLVSHD